MHDGTGFLSGFTRQLIRWAVFMCETFGLPKYEAEIFEQINLFKY
jgi:hypothetical protein